jgi:Carboxypeptidase regulatory-like domain
MNNLSIRNNILLIGYVLLSCRLIVFSQTSTAVLQGTVTDPAGALVPRAVVKIQQLGTGLERETLTGESGTYALNLLPVGTYSVIVEASGFKQARVQSVLLEIGQTRTLDVKLEVGEIQQTVEVVGSTQPLDRNSAVVGTVIGTQQIR